MRSTQSKNCLGRGHLRLAAVSAGLAACLLAGLVLGCSSSIVADGGEGARASPSADSVAGESGSREASATRLSPALPPPVFANRDLPDDPLADQSAGLRRLLQTTAQRRGTAHGFSREPPDRIVQRSIFALPDTARAEWDQAWAENTRLVESRQIERAIQQLDQVVAVEQRLFGAQSAKVAATVTMQADWCEKASLFEPARAARQRAVELWTAIYGPDYWHTEDMRLDLQTIDRLERLPPDAHRQFLSLNALLAKYRELADKQIYASAVPVAEQAHDICRRVYGAAHPKTAVAAGNLAHACAMLDDFSTAVRYYREALGLYLDLYRVPNPVMGSALLNAGNMFHTEGRLDLAERYLRLATEVFAACEGEASDQYAIALNNLGVFYRTTGQTASALQVLTRGKTIRNDLLREAERAAKLDPSMAPFVKQELLQLATVLLNLGLAYEPFDLVKAESYDRRALDLRQQLLGKSPATANALKDLANLYHHFADYPRSKEMLNDAIAMYAQHPRSGISEYTGALNDLGTLYYELADYAPAVELLARAALTQEKVLGGRHHLTLRSKANLAIVASAAGAMDLAEKLYQDVLEAREAQFGQESLWYAHALANYAELQRKLGALEEAKASGQRAAAIIQRLIGQKNDEFAGQQFRLGRIAWQGGDRGQGEELLGDSIRLTAEFVDLSAPALSDRQQLGLLASLRERLDTYLSLTADMPDAAERAYEKVLWVKGNVFSRQRLVRLVRSQPELQPQVEALQRIASHLAALATRSPPVEQRGRWQEQLAELTAQKERLERALAQASPLAQLPDRQALTPLLGTDATLVDFLEYVHTAPPRPPNGRAWSEERRLLAFVLRAGAPTMRVDLGPLPPLATAIEDWRRCVREGSPAGRCQAAAARIRAIAWLPLQEHVRTKVILFSPDGVLSRFPLAALGGRTADRYLVQDHEVITLPTPRLLLAAAPAAAEQGRPPEPPSLLLVGDVDFDAPPRPAAADAEAPGPWPGLVTATAPLRREAFRFAALPGTKAEVEHVAQLYRAVFPGGSVVSLQGPQGSEPALRRQAPQFRVLHLATHGYFSPPELRSALADAGARGSARLLSLAADDRPVAGASAFHPGLLSGVVLAGANVDADRATPAGAFTDDGVLTAVEAAELDLRRSELVVLSACETGLGEVAGGEGVLGLQRAFHMAGAKATLASLWKVDDTATAVFMTEFYRNLWERGLRPGAALQRTQLTMLGQYDPVRKTLRGAEPTVPEETTALAPLFWAAFVLSESAGYAKRG